MGTASPPAAIETTDATPRRQGLAALTLGAIGVVYGDIGTSPLYTVREIFAPATGVPLDAGHLVGALSVIVWALMLVVTLKYVILVLRADNRGEGGTLALSALAAATVGHRPRLRAALLALGVIGATLFYGDSVITPAISVLGAMEGLKVVTPGLEAWVVPLSVAILAGLFLVQSRGTGTVGRFFGPVIVVWFVTLAVTGTAQIVQRPEVLAALDPRLGIGFLAERGWHVFAAVGAIVLALTGAEALYADLGHFGRRPIRLAWTGLVYPALALNYLGQGALLMGEPGALENPFFRLFPEAWQVPALGLATAAAIIASQAVISGAYSVTRQAIQLGYLPRMIVRHTSAREAGQIYLPAVNRILLAGVIGAVLVFGSSSALAGAYGIAVTLTMLITTVLAFFVMRARWRVPAAVAAAGFALFLVVDVTLAASCAVKFIDGGWMPVALGAVVFALMRTWAGGRAVLSASLRRLGVSLEDFVSGLDPKSLPRAERTAVFLTSDPVNVPLALLHNLKHNHVLHRRNVVATVTFRDVPFVPAAERVTVEDLGHDFWRVTLTFGFMDAADVPKALSLAAAQGLPVPPFETSFFLSRETIVPGDGGGWRRWRDWGFSVMSRNAAGVVDYFCLPGNAVVELGARIPLRP